MLVADFNILEVLWAILQVIGLVFILGWQSAWAMLLLCWTVLQMLPGLLYLIVLFACIKFAVSMGA